MDDQQFDRLTASLAQAGSRRTALRGLAAVLGLGGVSLLATGTTARRRRHHGHRGGGGGGGGGGNGGGGGGTSCDGVDCPANTVCRNGTCVPAADRCGGPTGICNADPTPCGTSATGETCGCERTVEGNTVCVDGANACPQVVECTSTQDCEDRLGFHFFCQEAKTNAQGQFCGCGFGTATGKVCVAECDNPGGGGGGGGGDTLGLFEICEPGVDTCEAGLRCDSPTTRHTCSSTVEGVEAWCCVPPGGACTECDCCGNYYCAYDDDNNPTCQPNPEG